MKTKTLSIFAMTNLLLILLIFFDIGYSENITSSVTSTYYNGQPKIIQFFSNSSLIRIEHYYQTGMVRKVENYKDSLLNDSVVHYNSKGEIQFKGNYSMGKFISDTLMTFTNDGQIISRESYVNGLPNGLSFRYNENEDIAIKEYYIDGELDGNRYIYYNSGEVKTKENYIVGKLNGEKLSYYKDGSVFILENYKDGLRDGSFIYTNVNGDIILIGNARENVFDGKIVYYPENDFIVNSQILKPWKRVKVDGTFDDSCECYMANYKNGKLID